jgi:hypothetical protein
LELADAPVVLHQAVAPGVLISDENGHRKRVALPITTVLGARSYYDFLLSNRLAELKSKALIQAKRKDRRVRAAESSEGKERDVVREQQEADRFATEKTEHLLSRAAQQGWTSAERQAHVRAVTKPQALTKALGSEGSLPQAKHSPCLYEDTGGRLTMWPQAITNASSAERTALAEKLRILPQQLSS